MNLIIIQASQRTEDEKSTVTKYPQGEISSK